MNLTIKLVRISDARQTKPRVYFHPEGENVLENLARRTSRPYTVYRHYLEGVLNLAMKQAERASLIDAKANWSKHAGCTMCPCSPGFVLSGHSVHLFGYDIHVTISQDAVPATTGVPVERALQLAQIQEGTRVVLKETEDCHLQKATILGIEDDGTMMFEIDREDREDDDLDGLTEGALESIEKVLS